ncbi:MAG: hypothetical protein H6635_13665 [Anaerolineales bacterium]|nr:hypothetical protein [Anaerolineales bacterium]MCB9146415.1 hypothetical protein [Anaerolineales bacterium]
MKSRTILLGLTLLLGIFLFSCANNQTEQTDEVDTDAIRTQAVETFASNLTELAPTPTPLPTLTAVLLVTETPSNTPEPAPTSNPCYNLLYIADITIDDNTQMKPGETFTKVWEVQNIGGCAWRPGFTFRHVGGEPMRGNTVTIDEAIPTGAKRQLSVEMVVPSGINGVIESAWQMADENGVFFGDTLSVKIIVGNITTPSATTAP